MKRFILPIIFQRFIELTNVQRNKEIHILSFSDGKTLQIHDISITRHMEKAIWFGKTHNIIYYNAINSSWCDW
jgi:hypothetical protein